MQCREAREEFVEASDAHQPLQAAARAHIESCAACQSYTRELTQLDTWLALDDDQEPGPGFDTRFFARLCEEKKASQRPRPWLSRRWWALAGLSMVTAVAVAVVVLVPPKPSTFATDLEIAMHLELLEDLEVVQNLEDIETFEILAAVDEKELGLEPEGGE